MNGMQSPGVQGSIANLSENNMDLMRLAMPTNLYGLEWCRLRTVMLCLL